MNIQFRTKRDYQECIEELLANVKPFFSEDKSYVDFGETAALYDDGTIGLEAFARLLWGLVPFWAGSETKCLLSEIQAGIRCGSNPESDGYWGKLSETHQAFVEMAAMALGLLLTPEKVWEPLSAKEREAFNQWLLQINHYALPENNWYFFRVLVNVGLKKVGGNYSEAMIKETLNKIDSYYLGDGWYSDGLTMQRDYYISFAIHFYSLIYVRFMAEEDCRRCQEMKERAITFSKDFIYWFTEGGDALPYGRSLTYRFAQCAFWSAMAFADVEVFPWGVVKGIINRHFRSWFKKPILSNDGILTIGYGYPNLNMAEGYNAPGSPYWSFKSFLILALSDDHPFWQAEEEALPMLDTKKVMKHPMMIVTRPEADHVIALTSGQYPDFDPVHSAEKYAKFAYSSYFGFQVPRSYYTLKQAAPDNMLAFQRDGLLYVRRTCQEVIIEEDRIYSRWSPMTGITIETELKPYQKGHLRNHRINLEFDCTAFECGFAFPVNNYWQTKKQASTMEARIESEKGKSEITCLKGIGQGGITLCEANTNLLYPRTALPFIEFQLEKGFHEIEVYVIGTKTELLKE